MNDRADLDDSLQDRKSEKKTMETTITKINEEVDETDGKIGMSSKGSRQDKSQSTLYNNRSDILKVSEKNRNTLRRKKLHILWQLMINKRMT